MAKAKAVEAEEIVKTVRESEVAKRRATVEVMLARKNADEKRIEAEAERSARRSTPKRRSCSTRPRTC